MHEVRRNIMVGMFVLFGVGAFATLAVLFGQAPTWMVRGESYRLYIQMPSAAGAREGNVVTIDGIVVGRVLSIEHYDVSNLHRPNNVRITVLVEQKYRIPEGSTAITSEPGFGQGRPPISLVPGPSTNPPLGPGATIMGSVRAVMDSLIPPEVVSTLTTTAEQIREAAEALTPVLRDAHELMQKRAPDEVDVQQMQGNLSSAIARLDLTMKHLNEVVGDPAVKSEFRDAIGNFQKMSADGVRLVEDLRAAAGDVKGVVESSKTAVNNLNRSLENIDAKVNDVSAVLTSGLQKADSFMDQANQVIAAVAGGQGSLGRLLTDGELYESLVLTFQRIAATVEEYRLLAKEWQKGKVRVAF